MANYLTFEGVLKMDGMMIWAENNLDIAEAGWHIVVVNLGVMVSGGGHKVPLSKLIDGEWFAMMSRFYFRTLTSDRTPLPSYVCCNTPEHKTRRKLLKIYEENSHNGYPKENSIIQTNPYTKAESASCTACIGA